MKIKIADVTAEIVNPDAFTISRCRDYITNDARTDIVIDVTQAEIDAVKEENKELGCDGDIAHSFAILEKLDMEMLAFDAFYLHAAAVGMDGAAYAFTAKSGTGKSTHAALWQKNFGDRAHIVNGDRPFLRFIDGTVYACGAPWCGKECLSTNEMLPLKALYFLERGTENKAERASDAEVAQKLFRQLRLPKDAEKMDKLLSLLDKLVKTVPCYRLTCNMETAAAQTAYNAAKEK